MMLRDLSRKDIPLLCDYWYLSSDDHLHGMGVDLAKRPDPKEFEKLLLTQIQLPDAKKRSLALILEVEGVAVGHCNVNRIHFGSHAHLHLHLWSANTRKKGLGSTMIKQALGSFFQRLELEQIWSEPYAQNPAPNRTLLKLGFTLVKTYHTVPGEINFKQEVNQYVLNKGDWDPILLQKK